MKRNLQIIISASAASVLAFSALAQDTPNSKTDRPDHKRDRVPHERRADRLNGAAKASELIGMPVNNYQDEKLGKVEDLAVDVESGRVVQVILSTGGFIGIGDTLSAVPPGALHHDVAQKVLHLDASQEKLKNAPKFEMSRWAECCESNHLSKTYHHYGEEPALTFIHGGITEQDGKRNTEGLSNPAPDQRADAKWDKDQIRGRHQAMIPASRLGHVQQASKLMGTPVRNLQDEKLGKVEDLLVDLPSGRIVAIVVSSGGYLGLGDELSAVPPAALRFSADREALQLDASKEVLANAPHFKANQWPDFAQPEYAAGVYRAYRVEPYFGKQAAMEPDNTARNIRDRAGRSLTPLDQGNSKADVDITTRIRKEILAGEDMSLNAKNVKIITNQGLVTLRGPVNTAEEKRLIGEIANRVALLENVDNQLEVK